MSACWHTLSCRGLALPERGQGQGWDLGRLQGIARHPWVPLKCGWVRPGSYLKLRGRAGEILPLKSSLS